jgi:betaine-homocysteine S-methyltransferase
MAGKGLGERLAAGPVICAEGYLFELERRGYLQAGAFVPEAVLDHPEVVEQLHRDFVHAGSDVVEAFTYYAHREKLRIIDREAQLEDMNRQALRIAKRVAGVDFIIAETFSHAAEAKMALDAIKSAKLPAVVTMAIHRAPVTRDGMTPEDCCKMLADAGADVVGLNCIRGPRTMLPLIERIIAAVDVPVAALPVPYRTSEKEPTFQSLRDPNCDCLPSEMPFPVALDPMTCNRFEIGEFAKAAHALGARYLGVCCGAMPHHIRSVAEAIGRKPPASRYSADMSKHAFFGTDRSLKPKNQAFSREL